jgi:hypothetical protein
MSVQLVDRLGPRVAAVIDREGRCAFERPPLEDGCGADVRPDFNWKEARGRDGVWLAARQLALHRTIVGQNSEDAEVPDRRRTIGSIEELSPPIVSGCNSSGSDLKSGLGFPPYSYEVLDDRNGSLKAVQVDAMRF